MKKIAEKFDSIVQRRYYFNTDYATKGCPECKGELEADYCSVLLYIETKNYSGEFVTNRTGASFCSNCPVVVFDKEIINDTAMKAVIVKEYIAFSILGVIDYNAIPDKKSHQEIGTDENPLPVVNFLAALPKPRPLSKNEPCKCGSGKKYKRCCKK